MRIAPAHSRAAAEDGFVLIEILVSAIVLAIIAGAVFTLLNSTARSAADERNRSQAYAVAQEDQARLRSLRISELNRLNQTRTVKVGTTSFSVNSTGVFVNDTTSSASCTTGASSADYVKIASTVTWGSSGGRPPVAIHSIISPASGSIDPSHGNLTVSVRNAAGGAIPGIGLTGTGPAALSGTTDSSGCALFTDQPAGNYTLTPSGVAAGLVDKDGKTPGPLTVGISAGVTNPLQLLYDVPGSIKEVTFQALNTAGTMLPAKADSVVVSNTGMTLGKVFGNPGGGSGSRVLAIAAPSLFPFSSPDTVYAGSCGANNPNPSGETNPPGAAAMASVQVPPGGTVEKVTLQLPTLSLAVKSGASFVNAARVTVSDSECTVGGNPVKRTYTTNSSGALPEPELPWGTYDICASARLSSVDRRLKVSKLAVKNLAAAGTALTLDLSGSGIETGVTCP